MAEAIELAHANHAPLDWEALWKLGAITADHVEVAERVRVAEEA